MREGLQEELDELCGGIQEEAPALGKPVLVIGAEDGFFYSLPIAR